ncbi:MAG: tetratricopeptide repeat protein [Tepidisphaeraceae bacterium]
MVRLSDHENVSKIKETTNPESSPMARRVNTKFLITLTIIVVGAGLTLLIVTKLRKGDPAKFVATAKQLASERKYEEAVKNYQQAVAIDSKRPDVLVEYGDALSQLAGKDPENMRRARGMWQAALELDPANKAALSRNLDLYKTFLDGGPQPELASVVSQGRAFAERLAKVDPTNVDAAAMASVFTIRGWMYGVQTDEQRVADALAKLGELAQQNPTNADITYQFAIGKLAQAASVFRAQPSDAQRYAGEAAAAIAAGLRAQPENAAMQFRAFDVLSRMVGLTPNAEERQKYVADAKAAIEKAMEIAKPTDELYSEIHMNNAMLALQSKDRARGEKIARDLLAALPEDPGVRLNVATLLADDPTKRGEAIQILERPIAENAVTGYHISRAAHVEVNTLLRIATLRIDEFGATKDAKERETQLPKIEDVMSKLAVRIGGADNPNVLRLRGKLQRHQGNHVAAIQSLGKVVALMDQAGTRDASYYETVMLLAQSNIDTLQTGPAKELLNQILARAENHVLARLLLARLLVSERDFEAARPHVDYLAKVLPDVPDVIKLQLVTLDREKDKDQIKAAYAKLPEKSDAEMLDKSNTAMAIGDHADAERLLSAILAKTPGQPDASVLLARAYAAQNQKDKAAVVIADALKANPQNVGLQLLQKQLANATPEELRQFRIDTIEQLTDPTQKAVQLADLAAVDGKPDEALRHLKEAEKASPGNVSVQKALFNHHLARGQWDEATRYVDMLAKVNADQAGGLLYRVQMAMVKAQAATTPAERQAEVDKALGQARELTQRLPEFGQTWLAYAQALQASGQFEEATQRYATALEKQPENLDAMRGMVECYSRLNRPADAKRYIDAALKRQPNSAYFTEQLTNYELAFGDPNKALPQREAALKRNPENPQAWMNAGVAYLEAARKDADETRRRELLTKAVETFKGAIEKFPDEPNFYARLADTSLALKDGPAGEAALKQLAEREKWKDKPEPQLMLADFFARSGRLDESEAVLRDIMGKDPANVQAQLGLASLLSQRGKADDALVVLQANPDDPRVMRQRIELQIQTGKLDEADKSLQAALAKDPKSVDLLALSGFVNMGRGDWENADKRLQQALQLDPKNLVAQYYLGLVRLQQPTPNVDEAVQRLSAVRDQSPQYLDARFLLAQAYRRRNEPENAARELEAALQMQPTNKRVRMTLLEVYSTSTPPRWIDVERTIREGRDLPQLKDDLDLMQAEAMMWLGRKDTTKALAAAKQTLAAAPKNEAVIKTYLNILLDARDYAGAIKETDRLIAEDKTRWWAYNVRAVAKRYSNNKDGAMQDFESALAVAGEQRNEQAAQTIISTVAREIGVDEALVRILPRAEQENRWRLVAAQLYQAKGNFERAAEMVERVLADGDKLAPNEREQALRFAGGVYLMYRPEPQAAKAYDAYLKLLDLRSNDLGSLNNMACLLAEAMSPPRLPEALKYSQKAYQLMTESGIREPLIMDTHGWMLTLNDRPQEGIDVLRQAVSLKSFPEVHYHLGEAYLKTASPEDAQKQFEMAAEQIRQADEKKQDIDPALRTRVDAALAKAKEQVRTKSAAAAP